jgi:peptide deformylase
MLINEQSYQVLTYPSWQLDEVAKSVTVFDEHIEYIVKKMLRTMYAENGCGLAANQVGILQRIVVMDTGLPECHPEVLQNNNNSIRGQNPTVFINPIMISHTLNQQIISPERCLSFPDLERKMKRFLKCSIQYQDIKGKNHTQTYENLDAICIQHEIDHLNGITLASNMSRWQRQRLKKRRNQ